MSKHKQRLMALEWDIMRSIRSHGGANLEEIFKDLKSKYPKGNEVFECLAILMQTGIVSFSIEYYDFLFHSDVALSKLADEVKSSSVPTVSIEEYLKYGWSKLAGLKQ